MKFLIMFVALSIVNVIFSTIRSILTVGDGIVTPALVSGGYFAFYNIMLIYTVADFPMWQKCVITFCCNVLGVAIVKLIERKMRKDKLWLVKITVPSENFASAYKQISAFNIPVTYYNLDKYYVLDCYCETQKQTTYCKEISRQHNGKMFATANVLF